MRMKVILPFGEAALRVLCTSAFIPFYYPWRMKLSVRICVFEQAAHDDFMRITAFIFP